MSPLGPPQPGGTPPAAPAEEIVVQVRVEGNRTVGLEKIIPKIRTRAGRAYDEWQVQEDVRDLSKMGVFAYVHSLRQPVQGGVVVIFQVAERPLLQHVWIVGNDTYRTDVLRKEAELKVGDAADPFAVENGRRKILDYYQKKGYSKVRVSILEGDKVGDLGAVYVINEGPSQKVFWVNFVGNHFVSSARLKTLIDSHPPWFYLFSGEVDRKQIDEDVKKLTAYYRAFGFYYATISRVLDFNENQDWLTITFVIDEGPRYQVRNISFLGNQKIDTSRLAAKLKLLGGQYFDQNQQNLDLQKLRDEYGGEGYVFAKIEADNRLEVAPGILDIVYNVEEGSRYRIGRINIEIKGDNPHTQIMPVLNRLSIKPGDIADTREIDRQRAAAEILAALQGRAAEGHRAEDRLFAADGRQGHDDRRSAANDLLLRAGRPGPATAGRGLSRPQRPFRPPRSASGRTAEYRLPAGRLSAADLFPPDLPTDHRLDTATATELAAGRQ